MRPLHSRWQQHNRVPFAEHAINVFVAFTLLACGLFAASCVVYVLAGALALLRYAFGA